MAEKEASKKDANNSSCSGISNSSITYRACAPKRVLPLRHSSRIARDSVYANYGLLSITSVAFSPDGRLVPEGESAKLVNAYNQYSTTNSASRCKKHTRLVYIQALLVGLSTEEADEVTTYAFHCQRVNPDVYLQLRRRGFERAQAWHIINCASVSYEHVKYIVEAHRRGAADDAIMSVLSKGGIRQLALGLRNAARASKDPQS